MAFAPADRPSESRLKYEPAQPPEGFKGQFPVFVRGGEASASPLSRQSFCFHGREDAE